MQIQSASPNNDEIAYLKQQNDLLQKQLDQIQKPNYLQLIETQSPQEIIRDTLLANMQVLPLHARELHSKIPKLEKVHSNLRIYVEDKSKLENVNDLCEIPLICYQGFQLIVDYLCELYEIEYKCEKIFIYLTLLQQKLDNVSLLNSSLQFNSLFRIYSYMDEIDVNVYNRLSFVTKDMAELYAGKIDDCIKFMEKFIRGYYLAVQELDYLFQEKSIVIKK